MESILTSIKKLLGMTEEYVEFDSDIIAHINGVFVILADMGVGPAGGFSITDSFSTWKEYLPDDPRVELVKTYIHAKVKLAFDPPLSSAHIEALKEQIKEYEWRLANPV